MSMECYGELWSAINCKLVYIDIYRLSLCLYSKLIFPDDVDLVIQVFAGKGQTSCSDLPASAQDICRSRRQSRH